MTDVPADGTYLLHVRYANGTGADGRHQDRTATVTAGDDTRDDRLPDDGRLVHVAHGLRPGPAQGRHERRSPSAARTAASCHVNPDTIAVTAAGAAAPPPHLALGGYRRGLDGVDGDKGDPPATPGLLYQDGWYLLDDTHSALFDPATRHGHAAARPRRPAVPGRVRLRLRPRLQAGPDRPGHADRAARTAAAVGVRRVVLRVLSTAPRPTTRTRSLPRVPLRGRAAGRAGDRHRLQVAEHVERLGDRHRPSSPTPRRSSTGRRRRACTTRSTSTRASSATTRSSPRRRPRRRASCRRAAAPARGRTATPSTGATPTSSRRTSTCTGRWSSRAPTSGGSTGAATTRGPRCRA